MVDYNGTQAAIRAGYSKRGASNQGSRLLAKEAIRNAIKKKREIIDTQNIATAQQVEEFLTKSMKGEVTEEVLVTVFAGDGKSKVVSNDKQIPGRDRLKAAELLGKRYGLFTDKKKVEQTEKVELKVDWGEAEEK
ncbi:MAG: terminase small subunit [Streptococcaceae bacterium]|nr:terminase small subunit [Streptococcaceae bacterium]